MDILSAANDFFTALASASPSSSSSSAASSRSSSPSPTSTTSSSSRLSTSSQILPYFSTTAPVFVQHVHASNPHPQTSRLYGLNAVRSYFDLLDTHWARVRTTLRPTAAATASSKSDDPASNGTSSTLVTGLGGGVGGKRSKSTTSSPDSTPSLSDLMDVDEVDEPSIQTATSPSNPTSTSTSTSTSASALRVDHATRSVSLNASTTWKWRKSGHTWVEDFILTIHFDDTLKVTRFVVVTVSAPETCVLKAVDQVASGGIGGTTRMRSKSPSSAVGAASHSHLHVQSLSPTTIQRSRGFTSSIVETSIAEDVPMSGLEEVGSTTLKVPVVGGFKTRRATASGPLGGFVAGSGSWQDTAASGDGSKEWMQTRGPGAVFLV